MPIRVAPNLNLIAPVDTVRGKGFVHSTPLSRAVFEQHFIVISKAFAAIVAQGLMVLSGPRIAALMLRKAAQDMGVWDGRDGVENGLMAEIRRLSNIVLPNEDGPGWETMPYQSAITKKLVDEDDALEVEGQIVFFILVSAIQTKTTRSGTIELMGDLWETQTTSSNVTAWVASLPTSTEVETSASETPDSGDGGVTLKAGSSLPI